MIFTQIYTKCISLYEQIFSTCSVKFLTEYVHVSIKSLNYFNEIMFITQSIFQFQNHLQPLSHEKTL